MRFDSPLRHSWPTSVDRAREIQEALRGHVVREDAFDRINHVAGVDIGIDGRYGRARAAIAVLTYPECEPVAQCVVNRAIRFPYIPGYLSFREVPPILAALEKLKVLPDLVICDGQGIAHPRRFGLASHLGVLTGLPTIGAAKSRLTGKYVEPGPDKGDWSELTDKGETIGAVLRSRSGVQPLFVSVGHRVGLRSAISITLSCCRKFRLPETTRAAHKLASG